MKNLYKDESRNVDARDALLKYAKEAEDDPQWVAPAYQKTQPKTIFDMSAVKREDLKLLESGKMQKCDRCGRKLCVCNPKK